MPRILTLSGDQLPVSPFGTPLFHVHSLTGREGINQGYAYDLTLKLKDPHGTPLAQFSQLTPSITEQADWQLHSVVGSIVTLAIEIDGMIDGAGMSYAQGLTQTLSQANQGQAALNLPNLSKPVGAITRYLSALVSQASYIGNIGRSAAIRLTLVPWTHVMGLTSDFRVFQQQTIPQILEWLVKRYPYSSRFELTQTYPTLDYKVQYGDTDLALLQRLCEEAGINHYFEHTSNGATLVLRDNLQYPEHASAAYHTLYTLPAENHYSLEYIDSFSPSQTLVTGQVSLDAYQFKSHGSHQAASAHQPHEHTEHSAHNEHTLHEWAQGQYLDASHGQARAQTRMEQLRQHGYRASGAGNLRGLTPACTFKLANHPLASANAEWLVLTTEFTLTDVATETVAPNGQYIGQPQFEARVQFNVQPSNQALRPDARFDPIPAKPKASLQSAIVTGPENQEVYTDPFGRIRVRLTWQRHETKGAGNNDSVNNPATDTFDATSSCWIRYASAWSGADWGHVAIPRIGQEVLVSFIDSDPDLPIAIASLNNPMNLPPWQLDGNHALSGIMSKELFGQQRNYLVMDDTQNQVQTQLSSAHGLSQLALGYITRIPDTTGRKDYRGQGFELRTDAWGSLRAAKGMVVTTYAKTEAAEHISELSETSKLLQQAHTQHRNTSQSAIDHKADERSIDVTAQKQLQAQNEEVAGKADSGADKFSELSTPHLILSSPAGITLATPQTTHIASNEHIALTSGKDLSLSIGQRLAASVSKGITLFTQTLGAKLFAAKGKIEIQAQSDNIEIIAEQVLKLISAKKSIEIAAAEEILLTAKGSYIKINGQGIEQGTPANWKVHAASHGLPGAQAMESVLPRLGRKSYLELNLHWPSLEPAVKAPYYVLFEDGTEFTGILDEKGYARINNPPACSYEVWYGEDSRTASTEFDEPDTTTQDKNQSMNDDEKREMEVAIRQKWEDLL